jgi:Inner membrane component of T3SS, cytoplasmic domain
VGELYQPFQDEGSEMNMERTERTKSDLKLPDWSIHDPVIHLREWASDRIHYLPRPPVRPYQGEWFIGTDSRCVIRLADPRISRRHARLLHEDSRWGILDVGSRNGTRIDGNRQAIGFLGPGAEVTLGGLTLIAESARLLELRDFLCRWLGWANERAATVDLALRAVRLAQVRRTPLVLRGAGDLVPIARELHRLVFEAGAPFVMCGALGPSIAANIREAKVFEQAISAMRATHQGTLCVQTNAPPADFLQVSAELRNPSTLVQLITCDSSPGVQNLLDNPITIPTPADRGEEIVRVIEESYKDAAAALAISAPDVAAHRAWILRYSAATASEIVTGAYRLAALRAHGSFEAAARWLAMDPDALRDWVGDKGLPFP